MVPIIGLTRNAEGKEEIIEGSLGKLHSARVLKAIAQELGVSRKYTTISIFSDAHMHVCSFGHCRL